MMPPLMSGERPPRVPWWKRVLALPNVAALAFAIVAFAAGLRVWDSNRGAVLAALIASVIGGVTWVVVRRLTRGPTLAGALEGTRHLGSVPEVPDTPAPTILDPTSSPALAYRDVVEDLEANTHGQVVMVTAPAPGQGAGDV